jgi:hypothetical protein
MGHGFHEDGIVSAMNVAAGLKAPAPWLDQTVVAWPKHVTAGAGASPAKVAVATAFVQD